MTILKTGNNIVVQTVKVIRRRSNGFTLIEVMIAAAVLSLGAVLVYEVFFSSLDLFNYREKYFNLSYPVNEKIWHAQNEITKFGGIFEADSDSFEELIRVDKNMAWNLSSEMVYETDYRALYRIDFLLTWPEGNRRVNIKRTAFAVYTYK